MNGLFFGGSRRGSERIRSRRRNPRGFLRGYSCVFEVDGYPISRYYDIIAMN